MIKNLEMRPFIKAIQSMADEDPFWAESGLFFGQRPSAYVDHEFISELAVAYLHGPQNKEDRLDTYYQLYEEQFDDRDRLVSTFRAITAEIGQLIPELSKTRWRKKSDFYTLFLELSPRAAEFPWDASRRRTVAARILSLGVARRKEPIRRTRRACAAGGAAVPRRSRPTRGGRRLGRDL
jgi:hypothetical protein